MILKQFRHRGDNFSYVVADGKTEEAAVVDPSFNADVIVRWLRERKLKAKYVICTHGHNDHTAGNDDFRREFDARVVAYRLSPVPKDLAVADGDTLGVGELGLRIIHTPGHTPDGICLLVDGKLLTGDTLFVGECGRTDLPGGNPVDLYHSLFEKLMTLSDDVEVYPGHDYGPKPCSTVGIERRTNYTLEKRTLEEFVKFMKQP